MGHSFARPREELEELRQAVPGELILSTPPFTENVQNHVPLLDGCLGEVRTSQHLEVREIGGDTRGTFSPATSFFGPDSSAQSRRGHRPRTIHDSRRCAGIRCPLCAGPPQFRARRPCGASACRAAPGAAAIPRPCCRRPLVIALQVLDCPDF